MVFHYDNSLRFPMSKKKILIDLINSFNYYRSMHKKAHIRSQVHVQGRVYSSGGYGGCKYPPLIDEGGYVPPFSMVEDVFKKVFF